MKKILKIQAGSEAIKEIENNGFSQDRIKMMFGASGGPKWLVLYELDQYLRNTFFKNRTTPLHLLGSSIGSWRFACYAHENPTSALQKLKHHYIHFGDDYLSTPKSEKTREFMTNITLELVTKFVGEEAAHIANNEIFKLNYVTASSRGWLKSDHNLPLSLGLLTTAVANKINRRNLSKFFNRTLFYTDPKSPFFETSDFQTERIKIEPNNLDLSLLASASIPFFTKGIKDIPHAPKDSVYRDGGIIDYHFDIPVTLSDGIIFYPHFYDYVIPGWFDKFDKSKRNLPKNFSNTVMVSPGEDLIQMLPFHRIPTRKDFEKMEPEERNKTWETAAEKGKYMAEAFDQVIEKQNILSYIKNSQS